MSLKCKIDNPVTVGFETKLTLASVTTHKVPSEPTTMLDMFTGPSNIKLSKLYPLTRRNILGYLFSISAT